MKIFDSNNNYVGAVTGVFFYNEQAMYTEGDLVIDTSNNDMYVCIKDVPTSNASQYFNNTEYFRPFWYLYAIRDLDAYVQSVTPNLVERPVLKRNLDAVLERKFGTGIIIADRSVTQSVLDLNNIVHTGRYVIYINDYTSIRNIPPFILNSSNTSNDQLIISSVIGLDVFSAGRNEAYSVVQVLFSNNNNRVSVAVRRGLYSQTSFTWYDWQMLRSSFNIRLINNYLETHRNLVESLYDASRKQSIMVKLDYQIESGGNLRIDIPIPYHDIFRQISALFIISYEILEDNSLGAMVSDMMPLIIYNDSSNPPTSLRTRYRDKLFTVNIRTGSNPGVVILNFRGRNGFEPLRVYAIT